MSILGYSIERACEKKLLKALVELYTEKYGMGLVPAVDPTLIIAERFFL